MKKPALFSAGAAFVLVALLALPAHASAHALPIPGGDSPAAGADLSSPPSKVSLVFGEAPDPRLSRIQVFDSHEVEEDRGDTTVDSSNSHQLVVSLKPLPNGVYTVSWLTVSAVDGHTATGTYAFGVGASPSAAQNSASVTGTSASSSLNPGSVAGRALFYVGLMLALGAVFVALMVFKQVSAAAIRAALAGLGLALTGAVIITSVQVANAGAGLATIFSTTLGRGFILRATPIVVAILLTACVWVRRKSQPRLLMAGSGVCVLLAMFADVISGHAGASSPVALSIFLEWAHVVAAGIWIGGLLPLLLDLRGETGAEKARAVKRFSIYATAGIVVVGVTGLIRAATEIGSWDKVFSTTYGLLVTAKVVLFLFLAGLGAINHFINVDKAPSTLSGLRKVARKEVMIGFAVVLVAAALVNGTPPVEVAANAPQTSSISANGADVATTIRMSLTAAPGTAGNNTLSAHLSDYNSGADISNAVVTLRFQFLGGSSNLGPSTLSLHSSGNGDYTATGSNFSLAGDWLVTATVEHGNQTVQVQLRFHTLAAPPAPSPTVHVTKAPGVPPIYTVDLGHGDTVQVYLDPDKPGQNAFHSTYFGADGTELNIASMTATWTPPGQAAVPLTLSRFDMGHFIANLASVPSGSSRFDITATIKGGQTVQTYVVISP